ncbi:hypothetical protein HCN51_37545 [Nonomuraea sp. FMUSA5-5]|uniref:Uncharacterized protein n=1 Tax=Nonomuraea composti TaxID=2720023 RepID=A0ABX1BBX1_9ACTN|nr:hypothetical protein [Nonomuraea sp. FMUSA5-5]NJP95081.1 hypothetical protein [Nonomuraea sp. FMUSA5-5]
MPATLVRPNATRTGSPTTWPPGFDVPPGLAGETVRHVDEAMKDSILSLCRSALHLGAEREPSLAKMAAVPRARPCVDRRPGDSPASA